MTTETSPVEMTTTPTDAKPPEPARRPPRRLKGFHVDVEEYDHIVLPITFKNTATGKTESYDLEAIGYAGSGGAFAIASFVRFDDKGNRQLDMNGMRVFFKRVLVPESWAVLESLFDRQDIYIPEQTLGEIYQTLFEETANRPT